jgi:hypothetical protein
MHGKSSSGNTDVCLLVEREDKQDLNSSKTRCNQERSRGGKIDVREDDRKEARKEDSHEKW